MALFEDRDVRLARLEGLVDQHTERLNNIENWLRVIVGLQVTTLVAVIAGVIAIIQLLD